MVCSRFSYLILDNSYKIRSEEMLSVDVSQAEGGPGPMEIDEDEGEGMQIIQVIYYMKTLTAHCPCTVFEPTDEPMPHHAEAGSAVEIGM